MTPETCASSWLRPTATSSNIWLRDVEAYRCGSDRGGIATDGSYPEGYWRRGIHGIYYGASENGHYTYGGAIVNYYGHDDQNGAVLQIGNGARGLVVAGATLVRHTAIRPTIRGMRSISGATTTGTCWS